MFQYNCSILFLLSFFIPLLCTEKVPYSSIVDNVIYVELNTNVPCQQFTGHYGVRATYHNNYNFCNECYRYAYYSVDDFKKLFYNCVNDYEILNNYELYALPNFCIFARSLSCYQEFICSLHEKIKNDKKFRKKTAYVKGFHNSFGLWKEKSGFHDFVRDEVSKLQSQQKIDGKQGGLCCDKQSLDALNKDCLARLQVNSNNHQLAERIKAIEDTRSQKGKCFDYSSQVKCFDSDDEYAQEFSNTYGTCLDRQLHKELYQSRYVMIQLEREFSHNYHIQAISPAVHHYAAQAKMEKDPVTAFAFSDFCYAATQFLTHAMNTFYDGSCAIGRGTWKGAKEFANPERWRDMLTGALHMGLLYLDAIAQVNELNSAADIALFTGNHDIMLAAEEKYRLRAQERVRLLKECSQQTYQKVSTMPWQDIVEHGAEIGTTMILDVIALNALNGVRTSLVKNLTAAMESGALLTEQYAVEVAGFGKLIVEEGASVSTVAADIIKSDLVLLKNERDLIGKKIYSMKRSEQVINQMTNNLSEVNLSWKATNFAADKLESHFNKHVIKKAEWGKNTFMTMDEYLNKARNILNSEINDIIDGFVSKDGWVFRYDQVANELAIAKPNGVIETLFRPAEGMKYWLEQVKKYK